MIPAAPAPVDYQGIAILLGAFGAFVVSIGGFVLQVLTFTQQVKMRGEGQVRDGKIDVIASGVDGLNEKIASGAYAKGKIEGTAEERARPMIPAPPAT